MLIFPIITYKARNRGQGRKHDGIEQDSVTVGGRR